MKTPRNITLIICNHLFRQRYNIKIFNIHITPPHNCNSRGNWENIFVCCLSVFVLRKAVLIDFNRFISFQIPQSCWNSKGFSVYSEWKFVILIIKSRNNQFEAFFWPFCIRSRRLGLIFCSIRHVTVSVCSAILSYFVPTSQSPSTYLLLLNSNFFLLITPFLFLKRSQIFMYVQKNNLKNDVILFHVCEHVSTNSWEYFYWMNLLHESFTHENKVRAIMAVCFLIPSNQHWKLDSLP